jgi:hypothetical protein
VSTVWACAWSKPICALERLAGTFRRLRHSRRNDWHASCVARHARAGRAEELANDEQAWWPVAERAKTSDRQIPLRQRYAEILAT